MEKVFLGSAPSEITVYGKSHDHGAGGADYAHRGGEYGDLRLRCSPGRPGDGKGTGPWGL